MTRKVVYLIGALKNERIPAIANALEAETGYEVFADWFTPGPDADEYLRKYVIERKGGIREALNGYAVRHVFEFDKEHIDRADAVVMVMPAGKSGHLELGYAIGKGTPGFILFEAEPERFDVMWKFATGVAFKIEELVPLLKRHVG
jgi:hypothetical protein